MSSVRVHFATLYTFYEELESIIGNLEISTRLKSVVNETTRWEAISAEDRLLVNQFIKIESVPYRTVTNSLFISAISGFENFLRSLLSSIVKEVESYKEIPRAIINKNLQLSGVALSVFYSPPSHIKLDYPQMARNLHTCFSETEEVRLNQEITGFIKSLLDLDNVFSFLSDCEIYINWDDFGRNEEIRALLNTVNPRDTGKSLKRQLKRYIEDRNRIAHTGLSSSDISMNELKESMKYFINIAEFISDQCNIQLLDKQV